MGVRNRGVPLWWHIMAHRLQMRRNLEFGGFNLTYFLMILGLRVYMHRPSKQYRAGAPTLVDREKEIDTSRRRLRRAFHSINLFYVRALISFSYENLNDQFTKQTDEKECKSDPQLLSVQRFSCTITYTVKQ